MLLYIMKALPAFVVNSSVISLSFDLPSFANLKDLEKFKMV